MTTGVVHVVTHPEVLVDPDTPVPDWGLSDLGRQRVDGLLTLAWTAHLTALFSSGERKAVETAMLLGGHCALLPMIDGGLVEVDRTSTGYLPHDEHEAVADELFAHPTVSPRGWETAEHAQLRIVTAVTRCLAVSSPGDLAFVTHGGVAGLLLCHVLGVPIDRSFDQPGQGSHWSVDRASWQVLTRWERLPLGA